MNKKEKPLRSEDISSRILNTIENLIQQRGYPPSIREIQQTANIPTTSTVYYHLKKLEDKGLITREPRISRGITVTAR